MNQKIQPQLNLVTLIIIVITVLLVTKHNVNSTSYPKDELLGLNLAHSMSLLSESTREKNNTVRILFYGQSITRDYWWKGVNIALKHRFPHANIISKNLAIGGFPAQRLVLNTARDIISFYPDLIIFHVYGSNQDYERIIQKMRTLTTADIAIQTDHVAGKGNDWSTFMNEYFLPKIAAKYKCELIDVRSHWREYLQKHNYQPSQLLRDKIHLNSWGNLLMAQTVRSALVANPKAVDWAQDRTKTYEIKESGTLNLEFVGNRVDAIATLLGNSKAEIFIDGKHPSDIPDLYVFSRANDTGTVDWPWDVSAPFVISWQTPPVAEDWLLTILEVKSSGDTLEFTFELTGSQTGFDGIGNNKEKFISNSGRVVILPEHWWLKTDNGKPSPIKPGYKLHFYSELLGTDIYQKPPFRGFNREATVTLAQGLTNTKHTLTIVPLESKKVPIKSIRVYKPPLKESDLSLETITFEEWLKFR
ncbi:hypothetical protein [Gloeocapsa sp. PCC 73106]|uniref:SGNH/GDSL hydrolase family protein n=1 Tax=Gloeocapsa sp. PCC 73106 TaxID=102232 RepID=UPI0002ABD326|nr:hypothetical protein [Gloeocapsa sp. PCC 73106]ELR96250.1 hypothetical protein GLO73106DRAFT_00000380 [Gloeocapsa sp. PCC 73106]